MVSHRHKRTTANVYSHSCNSVHNTCANSNQTKSQYEEVRGLKVTPLVKVVLILLAGGRGKINPCKSIMLQTHPKIHRQHKLDLMDIHNEKEDTKMVGY